MLKPECKDFDALWNSKQGATFQVKAKGKTYTLPVDIPAEVVLRIVRLHKEYGATANVPEADLLDMMTLLMGKGNFDDLCSRGLSLSEMEELFSWLMDRYTGSMGDPNPNAETQEESVST
jgi:hypothetical protein